MKQVLHTEKAPAAIGPYAQGWKVGDMVYTSGQLGIDMETGKLAEGVEAQAKQALANLEAVLVKGGMKLADVVKTTVFLADMNDFAKVNKLYGMMIPAPFPARSCVEVAALPAGALVEIEAMALLNG